MGCKCQERARAIVRGASALVRGDLRTASTSAGFVARTFVQDARSGALKSAAAARLAGLRSRTPR